MSPLNGSVNLSPPQAVCGSPLSLHEEVVAVAVGMWTTRRVAQGVVGRPAGAVHSTGMSTAI
jgi:hypothetical protein